MPGPGRPPGKGRGSGASTPKEGTTTPGASGGATPPHGAPPLDLAEWYKQLVVQLQNQVDRKEEYKGQKIRERKEKEDLDRQLQEVSQQLAMATGGQAGGGAAGGGVPRGAAGGDIPHHGDSKA